MSEKPSAQRLQDYIFVVVMWLLSRYVIIGAAQLTTSANQITPVTHHLFATRLFSIINWELFSQWDGEWFRSIATLGYEYINDGQRHNIAFFPLFPLVVHGVMLLGFSFEVAGTLVNNLALLGAMIVAYCWTKERNGFVCARWVTAILAWCPYSLFASVTYSEGLFLLLTTASLQAFDKRQHLLAACLGAMATATRLTGAALIPTFLLIAWQERRPFIAYIASVVAGSGLFLFSIYCAIHFADPLAFLHAQRGWGAAGFVWKGWSKTLIESWAFLIICLLGYLLWRLRNQLSPVAVTYGFFSLILLLAAGRPSSTPRFLYGTVSITLALGVFFGQHPRIGFSVIGCCGILLMHTALNFFRGEWIA